MRWLSQDDAVPAALRLVAIWSAI